MKRLNFLREKFNVIPSEDFKKLSSDEENPLHYIEDAFGYKEFEDSLVISLSETLFLKLVDADPTKNKMYVQWLLNIFIHKVQKHSNTDAVSILNLVSSPMIFINEDLPKTRENLELFEANKRKKRFKEFAAKNYALRNIADATDINQYDSIEKLFDAVYPFKPKISLSDLEKEMEYCVSINEGEIPVKNEKYTIFIPKTLRASELFRFTNWCTGSLGNTMFKHYTRNNVKSDGTPSDLIIVIDNGFLKGENNRIYQIHFETSQIMDKKDRTFGGLRHEILEKDISVRNFFYETLFNHIKSSYNKEKNKDITYMTSKDGANYVKHVLQLGFGKILFDVMDDNTETISFMDCSIETQPDLSRFKNLCTIYFDNVKFSNLDDTFFSSPNLKIISIPRNNITKIPDGIGNCKNLKFINLKGNPIGFVSENIKYLDRSRGGSLEAISIDKDNVELINKLMNLLPNVAF